MTAALLTLSLVVYILVAIGILVVSMLAGYSVSTSAGWMLFVAGFFAFMWPFVVAVTPLLIILITAMTVRGTTKRKSRVVARSRIYKHIVAGQSGEKK